MVTAPRGQKRGIVAAEAKLTSAGTLALGGPMVPRAAFPPGAERSGLPHFKVGANGFVDTGYGCRSDSSSIVVTGPPPGMVSVGAYRFMLDDMQQRVNHFDEGGATVAALPDVFAGHRLVGSAKNVQGLSELLQSRA